MFRNGMVVLLVALMGAVVLMVADGCGGGGGGPNPNAFPKAGVVYAAAGIADISLAGKLVASDGLTYLTFTRDGTGAGQIKIFNKSDNVQVGLVPIGKEQKLLSLALRTVDLNDGHGLQPYLLVQYDWNGWVMELNTMEGGGASLDGAIACLAANFTATDIVMTNDGTTISGHLALPHS